MTNSQRAAVEELCSAARAAQRELSYLVDVMGHRGGSYEAALERLRKAIPPAQDSLT